MDLSGILVIDVVSSQRKLFIEIVESFYVGFWAGRAWPHDETDMVEYDFFE